MNKDRFNDFFIEEESEKIKHQSTEVIQELNTPEFEIQIEEEEM